MNRYDVLNNKPIEFASKIRTPGIFLVSTDDKIAVPEKVEEMYKLYSGKPKKLRYLKGSHNTIRRPDTYEAILKFFKIIWEKKSKKRIEAHNLKMLRNSSFQNSENFGPGLFDEVNVEMKMRKRVNDYEASKRKFPRRYTVSDERSGVGNGIFGKITGKSYRYGSVNYQDQDVIRKSGRKRESKISRRIGLVEFSQ